MSSSESSTGRKVSNWSAPNIITIVRILFAPAFIWLLLISQDSPSDPARWWAAALFVVGMATDGIDGFIARRYNLVTDLGKILDPIATSALLPLQALWGDWMNVVNIVLMGIALALTVVTGVMYLVEAWLHNRTTAASH